MKVHLLIVFSLLAGCVAYPAYYPAQPATTDPNHAQRVANEQCAKSGKIAVKVAPTNCSAANCTTAFECR